MTRRTVIEIIMQNGKLSEAQAERVLTLYKRLGVLKSNAHDGYQISHGGFFDLETIQRAVAQ